MQVALMMSRISLSVLFHGHVIRYSIPPRFIGQASVVYTFNSMISPDVAAAASEKTSQSWFFIQEVHGSEAARQLCGQMDEWVYGLTSRRSTSQAGRLVTQFLGQAVSQ